MKRLITVWGITVLLQSPANLLAGIETNGTTIRQERTITNNLPTAMGAPTHTASHPVVVQLQGDSSLNAERIASTNAGAAPAPTTSGAGEMQYGNSLTPRTGLFDPDHLMRVGPGRARNRFGGVIPGLANGGVQEINPLAPPEPPLAAMDRWTGPLPDHVNGVSVVLFSFKF